MKATTTTTTTATNDTRTPRLPSPSMRLGRRALLASAASVACGSGPPAQAPVKPAAMRYSGRLQDYVPSAGLRWLVLAQPAKLAENQSFRPGLELVFSTERLRAFAATSGFALESVPRGLIAGFDLCTLYLAELSTATADRARAKFDQRQLRGASERRPDPNIVVQAGVAEGVPVSLVTIDERVLAYAVGDPLLGRIVETYARGKLKAKRAFEGAALRGFDEPTASAPLAAFVPGPFAEQWHAAAGGLLAAATALNATLSPTGSGRALLELRLHGDFSETGAAERLKATYMSVAGSSTGSLLGLGNALDAQAEQTSEWVRLRVPLPITEVARGARAATSADLDEIFRLSAKPVAPVTPTLAPEAR